jgi:Tfp pilus assembly protein PilX
MPKSSGLIPPRKTGRRKGVALVIVLAFVVIITGVIVAYFTRALANRQISNSSASQTKAALFAQGAADAIIANIQEEIVLTSSTSTYPIPAVPPSTSSTYGTIYTPLNPAAAMPQMSGTIANGITTWAPNFLIRSAASTSGTLSQPFYSGSNSASIIYSNAIAVSSTIPSLNGRSVSVARWNSHYLLPLQTGSDSTPMVGTFAPPDWVLVARNGSNPAPTNPSASGVTWSSTNGNTVVGRYAYAIYHEGGLLDANVAGYPSFAASDTGTAQYAYKPALATADLTQLGLSQSQVNQLVGWRNYATTQAQGDYPNYTYPRTTGSLYLTYATANPTSYLRVSGTQLNLDGVMASGPNAQGQTDRMFGSRQELIDFVQKGLGVSGTTLDVLNYLGTFSRGVNQPSLAPDPTRPLVPTAYPASNGGNNVIYNGQSLEVNNYGGQVDPINPSFLSVRVSGTGGWQRNDGTTAIGGEPLVKTRFALSRLAWITYLGPSANRTIPTTNPGVNSPNYDMWQLVHNYGISPSYLALGGTANIQKYFGLVWQPDTYPASSGRSAGAAGFHDGQWKWFYENHNTTALTGNPVAVSGTSGPISRLMDIAAQTGANAREPDFFELLKATVLAGSKAKGAMNTTELTSQLGTLTITRPMNWTLLSTTRSSSSELTS